MRNRLMGLSIFLMILTIVPIPVRAESPRETIQRQVNRVLDVLRNSAEAKAVKEKKILSIVDEFFDYTELSKRTLANHWKSFSPEQQKEFTTLFGKLLGNVYMDRIMQYTNEKVVFGKETKLTDNTVEVQSEIVTQTKSIPLNYRMISQKGDGKVYDVVVEGISLVMNYRSQFREILANKPPEDLLKMLREKVLK
ncbi:MAG: ABC transporter substrate-binding protein [Deltaproteobacteria bacterium]